MAPLASASPAGISTSLTDPADALWSRLRRIERAFRQGDAGALRASFCSSGKLRVDLRDVPDSPASYAPGQLQVIFAQMFAEARTREFAFRRDEVALPSEGTAFARARWVREARSGEATDVQPLTFTLREEDGDWRIHEILAPR